MFDVGSAEVDIPTVEFPDTIDLLDFKSRPTLENAKLVPYLLSILLSVSVLLSTIGVSLSLELVANGPYSSLTTILLALLLWRIKV
jgi:hypothetical protein